MVNIRYKKNKLNFGFTLVELLTVMSIIGILAAISIFALAGARESARDARRKGDLEAVASALELLKADCNYYPVAASFPAAGSQLTGSMCSLGGNIYMQAIPDDPSTGRDYAYQPLNCGASGCTRFRFWATLENPETLPAGCGSAPYPSCGSATCNFCVFNP